MEAQACVVSLGNESARLVRSLGIRLAIAPVKGYSLTFPVDGWNEAPAVPFADDGHKVAVVRLEDRVRVAGTAEFAGTDRRLTPERIAHLRSFFLTLFPGYPHDGAGEGWTALRPMTPDGAPYIGPTPVKGLYLNTGHGHLGWTMACGSGRIVSDLVLDRPAAIELAGLTHEGR